MILVLVLLLLGITLAVALCRRCSRSLKLASLLPAYISFVVLYIFTSDEVAQDRSEYYRWYLDAEDLVRDLSSRDSVFSVLLSSLPDGLSQNQFAVFLSSIVFLLLTSVIILVARKGVITWGLVPSVLLVAVCDRLFLDMVFNATRSSLAALVFALGVIMPRRHARALLWAVALGIHTRLGLLLLGIYGIFVIPNWSSALLRAFLVVAMSLFAVRVATGGVLFPELQLIDFVLSRTESESVVRGLTSASELTLSLVTQILIALLIPTAFLLADSRWTADQALVNHQQIPVRMRAELTGLAVGTVAVGLALYPDLMYAQRLFVIPILALPLLLSDRWISVLVIVKFVIIAPVLKGHLT